MNDPVPPYHEHLTELAKELTERGSQGLVVIDASPLEVIEEQYGSDAFEEVRQRLFKILREQKGKEYRNEDVLTLDRPGGLRFIFFLERKRRRSNPTTIADLKIVQSRMAVSLVANLGRAAFPYCKAPPRIEVGYGMAVYNPLLHPSRIALTAFREALEVARHLREAERLLARERLLDIILRERVVTAFQPIMRLGADRTVLGFEALSRGPKGSGLERADDLFGSATEHQLLVELDRLCRRRALLSSGRIPTNAKIFINTLPATIRDPQFRGRALIEFLDKAQVSPDRIVIENYNLFREAMAYFTDLGMSFAVDDVGSGYSGLESIARLKPTFLKIDISLIRDVHVSHVNQAMVGAIIAMGHGIGAAVIGEGIQTEDEAATLLEMGVDWGQGFQLGRPEAPAE